MRYLFKLKNDLENIINDKSNEISIFDNLDFNKTINDDLILLSLITWAVTSDELGEVEVENKYYNLDKVNISLLKKYFNKYRNRQLNQEKTYVFIYGPNANKVSDLIILNLDENYILGKYLNSFILKEVKGIKDFISSLSYYNVIIYVIDYELSIYKNRELYFNSTKINYISCFEDIYSNPTLTLEEFSLMQFLKLFDYETIMFLLDNYKNKLLETMVNEWIINKRSTIRKFHRLLKYFKISELINYSTNEINKLFEERFNENV